MNSQNQLDDSKNFLSKIPDDWESIDELRVNFKFFIKLSIFFLLEIFNFFKF